MTNNKIQLIVSCNYASALMEAILERDKITAKYIISKAIEDSDITTEAFELLIKLRRFAREEGYI